LVELLRVTNAAVGNFIKWVVWVKWMDTSIAIFKVSFDGLSQGGDCSLDGILSLFDFLVYLGPEEVSLLLWAWRCFS
jgi:hypothetical protein